MNWNRRNRFQQAIRGILSASHRLDRLGFVASNDGNISIRFEPDRYLITRSMSVKGRLEPLDILVVNEAGVVVEDEMHPGVPAEYRVSSEWKMHLAVYHARPDVDSIVHAHPPFATAWAASRQGIPENVLPEIIVALQRIPLVQFANPGSSELAIGVANAMATSSAALLANHGALTVASDPIAALDVLERLEHAAKILLLSKLAGGAKELSSEERTALLTAYGIQ